MKFGIIFISFFLFNCSKVNQNQLNDDLSLTLLLNIKMQRATISGKAMKGEIRDGLVNVHPLEMNGKCNTDLILGTSFTDSEGKYSVTFNRTGGSVCVSVKPNPRGGTRMLDESTGQEIPLLPNSTFSLTNIVNESTIIGIGKSNAMISPFSNMMTRRVLGKTTEAPISSQSDLERLVRSSGKEVVIRFGLNRGFGGKSNRSLGRNLNDADFPELNDLVIDLRDTNNPVTQNFFLLQASFSALSSANKSSSSLNSNDIESTINAFSEDMSDGKPDGKDANGNSISINNTVLAGNPISCGGDPTDPTKKNGCVMGGAFQFAANGGVLPGGVKIDTEAIKTQAQQMVAAETAVIIVSDAPISAVAIPKAPTISYTSSTSLYRGVAVSLVPTNTGSPIDSCAVSPALPAGLSLSNTCVISGTPTTDQTASDYEITATNSIGTGSVTLSISVSLLPPTISTATYYTANDNGSFTISPSLVGFASSCYVQERFWNDPDSTTNDYWDYRNYTLPYGLSINNSTCEISGTVTIPVGSTFATQESPYLRIVAVNSAGTGVSDANPATVTNAFRINFVRVPVSFSPVENISLVQGEVSSSVIPKSGGSGNCILKKVPDADLSNTIDARNLINPTLPAGLVLDSASCTITGTPTATGSLTNLVVIANNGASLPAGTLTYIGHAGFSYSNLFNLEVTPHVFTIGGTVSGLAGGESIVLNYHSTPANAATQSVTISANGAYGISDGTYAQTITAKNIYEATPTTHLRVATHPANKYCIFSGVNYNASASGTLNANLTNFNISCMPTKYMFQPAYASYGGDIGGIAGGDSKCNTKGTSIGVTNSKAFLFLTGVRQACNSTTDCMTNTTGAIDYPLQPNTVYLGKGGTATDRPILYTDAYGRFNVPANLINPLDSTTMAFSHGSLWIGFNSLLYSTGGDNTCGSWNYSGGGLAAIGYTLSTSSNSFLRYSVHPCDSASESVASFLCFEQ
jgi:hypothetical protein